MKQELHLFDYLSIYYLLVFGIYILISLFIGAEIG